MKKVLPPTYFFVAIVLTVAIHFVLPLRQWLHFPWRLLGLFPIGFGIALNLVADQVFKRRGTTVKPFEVSKALVTDGVYGLSRHPMYLGMVSIILGIALLLGSLLPFGVVVLLALLFDHLFIGPEERILEDTFGDAFRDYKDRVRRWI